eukprot:TRINITY_DN13380_c0_g1_i1.p1 TRINITY_DN13380_c0_g1~~TRINITY_DN13380_c0_g1_i1.p1  ORF type:complete len:276 (+),score=1.12 TRINITY_DN13380_c0_g1_i1:69-896(+)
MVEYVSPEGSVECDDDLVPHTLADVASFEEIAKLFHCPMKVAVQRLGVCSAAIKRICREHGIHRWPYRKIQAAQRRTGSLGAAAAVMELTSKAYQEPERKQSPPLDGPRVRKLTDWSDAFADDVPEPKHHRKAQVVPSKTAPSPISRTDVHMPHAVRVPINGFVSTSTSMTNSSAITPTQPSLPFQYSPPQQISIPNYSAAAQFQQLRVPTVCMTSMPAPPAMPKLPSRVWLPRSSSYQCPVQSQLEILEIVHLRHRFTAFPQSRVFPIRYQYIR